MALFSFLPTFFLYSIASPASAQHTSEAPGEQLNSIASPASAQHTSEAPGEQLNSIASPASAQHISEEPGEQQYTANVILTRQSYCGMFCDTWWDIDACFDPLTLTIKQCNGFDCNEKCHAYDFSLQYSLKDGDPSQRHNCSFVYEDTSSGSPPKEKQYLSIHETTDAGGWLTMSTTPYHWYFEKGDSGFFSSICDKPISTRFNTEPIPPFGGNCMDNGAAMGNGVTKGSVVRNQNVHWFMWDMSSWVVMGPQLEDLGSCE